MAVTIVVKESGKEFELELIDPMQGVSWVSDMLGNHGVSPDDEGVYHMDEEDTEWWVKLTKAYQKADDEYQEVLLSLTEEGYEEMLTAVNGISCDLEDYPANLRELTKGFRQDEVTEDSDPDYLAYPYPPSS